MATADDTSTVTCNTGQITIPKATIGQQTYCNAASSCEFFVTVSDNVDGTVFSTTEVSIPLTGGDNTIIPNLNPAALPICPHTVDSCLTDGSCAESQAPNSSIQLCDNPADCGAPG